MKTIKFTSSKEWDMVDITDMVQEQIAPDENGFCLVYCPHTSGSILVGEKEEKLLQDYERVARTLLAAGRPFLHSMKGHMSGEAHTFCFLHGFEALFPVEDGKLVLGKLQRIFFVESTEARDRELWVFPL